MSALETITHRTDDIGSQSLHGPSEVSTAYESWLGKSQVGELESLYKVIGLSLGLGVEEPAAGVRVLCRDQGKVLHPRGVS